MQYFKAIAQPLLGEFGWGCCCCCYYGKTKLTPRFGLGWEFGKKPSMLYACYLLVFGVISVYLKMVVDI